MNEKWFWLALIVGIWYFHNQTQQQGITGPLQSQAGGGPCQTGYYQATSIDGQPVCLPIGSTS